MSYTFAIEEYKDEEFNVLLEKTGLSLASALDRLREFADSHKNGDLMHGTYHLVEYEVDGAELSCWIDFDD